MMRLGTKPHDRRRPPGREAQPAPPPMTATDPSVALRRNLCHRRMGRDPDAGGGYA